MPSLSFRGFDLERWTSSEGEEEIHFFLRDKRNTYAFGFNPRLIPEWVVRAVLRRIGGDDAQG